jgi:hypothetical protein
MTHPFPAARDTKRSALLPLLMGVTLTALLLTTWGLTHRYRGLMRDGQLYAFQAKARLAANLQMDVYLAHTSQDRFTIFSRLYASLIGPLGLPNAELLLFTLCTVGFLAAAWDLAGSLSNRVAAWLAVGLLITTVGTYGAYSIFQYSESYLTARSLAEALIVASLAAHFRARRILGLAIAALAMFVHPLLALPGLLLLVCLSLPVRAAAAGALLAVLGTFGIALIAVMAPAKAGLLTIMDAAWLEVVRERSLHLFLQYWTSGDWETVARPLLCLSLTWMVIDDHRVRGLCACASLVGLSGLAVALIAGTLGPVAILLQGQAWRWMWVTTFLSVLLLAPTVLIALREKKCGALCAILLIACWTFPAVDGVALAALALFLWWSRDRIEQRTAEYLKWAGYALLLIIIGWLVANSWSLLTSPSVVSTVEPATIDRLRSIFALQVSAVLLMGALGYWVKNAESVWQILPVTVLLLGSSVWIVPWSFQQPTEDARAQLDQFSDWRDAIPPTANVLTIPVPIAASFVWFTLERPNYYSLGQSAGVVFSRATAAEIRRRSQVLMPVSDPDWQILSKNTQKAEGQKTNDVTRPLTAERLIAICADSQLGFVIAKETLDFEPIRHTRTGAFKDWNLYDCHRVRLASPSA